MVKTNPARGMRDFLPADVRKREYVIGIIKQVFGSFGFEPLETPAVEDLETLTGKYGEEGSQLIFKILKRGEKLDIAGAAVESDLADLALRYDLTVPLARVVANNRNDLPKFFKRFQIQPVWRADRPARGRFREFYQCDVDAIGSRSMLVEAELIAASREILTQLGFRDFVIRINHREVLRGMLDAVGIEAGRHADALVALDKLDKIGSDGVLKEFEQRGIAGGEKLIGLFEKLSAGGSLSDIEVLREFIGEHSSGKLGLDELDEILALAGSPELKIDASLARGLSYYTGAIMEISVPDLAGSLGGGGRYDGLIGMFGKEAIPACGISLGLERIVVVMDERKMFPPSVAAAAPADVMVTVPSRDAALRSITTAARLRDAGLRVVVYPDPDKFGKQLKYADQIGVPWVCIVNEAGGDEALFKLKNMQSGEESLVSFSALGDLTKTQFS